MSARTTAAFALHIGGGTVGLLSGVVAASVAVFVFTAITAIAAISDIRVVARGGIDGAPRIARHLWRMCTAWFVASGSFFLGQQKVMPAYMHGSPLLFIPALAPLVFLMVWMVKVRWPQSKVPQPKVKEYA